MKFLGPLCVLALALSGCPSRTTGGVRGVAAYAQATDWRPPPADAALWSVVARAAPERAPSPDPALASVAAELARRVARDPEARTPTARVIQAVSWLSGITEPLPMVLTVKGRGASVDAEVERGLRDLVATEHVTHVGLARATAADGAEVAVLAASRRRVRLDAIPRTVRSGANVRLAGRLDEGLRTPTMVVTLPDGRTEESPLGEGPDFVGQFRVGARGAYQFEITADSEAGSTVVANFPVYVDAEPPATPEETASPTVEEPAAAESALFAAINDTRRRHGLAPLERMDALVDVARAHARDMAEHRYVAHNRRDGTTPGQRLRDAGLLSGLSLENVARGYGAAEVHEGLMASPGHRANILDRRVTHVGIGVAREDGPSGALLVAQDFIEVARPIDVDATSRALLEAINRNRATRGLPLLTSRAPLEAAAARAARAFFADPSRTQEQALSEATDALRTEGLLFRRVSVTAAFGPRAEDAAGMQPLFDRDVTAVGIGVAQGDRPGAPPRSVLVVFVLAVPR